ncbi:alpha-L-rhamnosidase C-terminal domain-containing protein [Sphingobacterium faecium]|uniref:alpha-L-rhamnosidase-related protein n=1 Tax=Sphingobacterium faecium TaxID=34087 RepID=UPI00246825D9|nr:alpha-L-rhamnosidase C-terminal domain-containing protein [Sphingobacterium faecium]MDH5826441.1 alpha-L-rhamnosidase C-terminal domain-containing protein [Sphingobacterium faecium]
MKPSPVIICLLFLITCFLEIHAQTKLSDQHNQISPLTTAFVYPERIVWKEGNVMHDEYLLRKGNGQANLHNPHTVILKNDQDHSKSSVLLDFGKEMNASLDIITGMWGGNNLPKSVRIRFGESVSEAMSEIGVKGATNDHALRDFTMQVPWLGRNRSGESGFRFVRIDFLEPHAELHLREVRAVATYRDVPYLGSFKSSDERLNKIWEVGAYTVHVNMQDYLWDGIKRDRLVWVGDLHPEVATVNAVFGFNDVVPKSLDLAKESTPLPSWMSGHSSYSMWWIILHYDWYMNHGNKAYLAEQQDYLQGLVKQIIGKVVDGTEQMDGARFLDWPSSEDSIAVHAGLQALTIKSLENASFLFEVLNDRSSKKLCDETVAEMRKKVPAHNNSKQAAALLSLVGLMDANTAYTDVLAVGGAKNFSTFYGYYMLEAMAKAGKYQEAMDIISTYWGAMLDLGATTFWEDFNMDWLPNAARIDELVPEGKTDIHADFGAYCYLGLRHSLAHGWASGPTAWMSSHILGIQVAEPGGKVYTVKPHLGDLTWAEGTFPTPYGLIHVKHVMENGRVKSVIKAPKEVKIIQ